MLSSILSLPSSLQNNLDSSEKDETQVDNFTSVISAQIKYKARIQNRILNLFSHANKLFIFLPSLATYFFISLALSFSLSFSSSLSFIRCLTAWLVGRGKNK